MKKTFDIVKNLNKIIINTGLGKLSQINGFEDKVLPEINKELSLITGQKPAYCSAKKSISGFKLRQGIVIGLKTTLRGRRMINFLNKLNSVVLPRLRDFRGLDSNSVTKEGDLSIGLKEHIVFPEIVPEHSKINFGLQITIVPKTRKKNEAVELYRELKIPFKK